MNSESETLTLKRCRLIPEQRSSSVTIFILDGISLADHHMPPHRTEYMLDLIATALQQHDWN